MLVTLSGDVRRPGVCEVPCGISLPDLLAIGGVGSDAVQACWSAATTARGSGLRTSPGVACSTPTCAHSAPPSAAVRSSCSLRRRARLVETARVLRWMAGETAGQCGPCVHGLPALAGAMSELASGVGSANTVADLHRWSAMVDRRGGCTFPDGAVRLVRSTLRVFAGDVEHHVSHGICPRVNAASVMRIPEPEPAWR